LPPADERREPRSDAWTQSRVILSSQALAEPRKWKAAESLKRLEPQTRLQQLCDFEAILQINRQYDQYAADFVIAYATEATVRKGEWNRKRPGRDQGVGLGPPRRVRASARSVLVVEKRPCCRICSKDLHCFLFQRRPESRAEQEPGCSRRQGAKPRACAGAVEPSGRPVRCSSENFVPAALAFRRRARQPYRIRIESRRC
jgi:hypothetical protein